MSDRITQAEKLGGIRDALNPEWWEKLKELFAPGEPDEPATPAASGSTATSTNLATHIARVRGLIEQDEGRTDRATAYLDQTFKAGWRSDREIRDAFAEAAHQVGAQGPGAVDVSTAERPATAAQRTAEIEAQAAAEGEAGANTFGGEEGSGRARIASLFAGQGLDEGTGSFQDRLDSLIRKLPRSKRQEASMLFRQNPSEPVSQLVDLLEREYGGSQ